MSRKNKQVNTRKWHSSVGYKIFIVLVMLFIYAPIFSLILFSFNAEKSATRWGGFSLTHYESLFENQAIIARLPGALLPGPPGQRSPKGAAAHPAGV